MIRKNLIILILIICFLLPTTNSLAKNKYYIIKLKIIKIIDGDTILIKTKEGAVSVRLSGIDCFETKMNSHIKYQKTDSITYDEIFYLGYKGKNALEKLIINKNIELEITGIDKKYGRFVGICKKYKFNHNKK